MSDTNGVQAGQRVVQMRLSDIRPDKMNPRQEFIIEDMARLEESIKKRGILNPLLVEATEDGYLIVDGERRYRVATRLKMTEVPVRITSESLTERERLLVRFNLQEVHSPWTAWDKSVAVAELQEMTQWSHAEMARQLGVSPSSIATLMALQKLSKRTISVMQKAKIPVEAVARVAQVTKKMTPEKAAAVEEAFCAGVEEGKIYDKRSANKFYVATRRATVEQLQKYAGTKAYDTAEILKDNNAEHATVERSLNSVFVSARSLAKNLAQVMSDNPNLIVQERTQSNIASLIVHAERLLRVIGKRVETTVVDEPKE